MMVLVFIGIKISMPDVTIVSNKLALCSHVSTQSIIALRLISSRYFRTVRRFSALVSLDFTTNLSFG